MYSEHECSDQDTGQPGDEVRAELTQLYEEAKTGDAAAVVTLGDVALSGLIDWLDPAEAFERVEEVALSGYLPAVHLLSHYYLIGFGTEQDLSMYYALLMQASCCGSVRAGIELRFVEGGAEIWKLVQRRESMLESKKRAIRELKKVARRSELQLRQQMQSLQEENRNLHDRISTLPPLDIQGEIRRLNGELASRDSEMGRLNTLIQSVEQEKSRVSLEASALEGDLKRRIKYLEGLLRKNGIPFNAVMGHGDKDSV